MSYQTDSYGTYDSSITESNITDSTQPTVELMADGVFKAADIPNYIHVISNENPRQQTNHLQQILFALIQDREVANVLITEDFIVLLSEIIRDRRDENLIRIASMLLTSLVFSESETATAMTYSLVVSSLLTLSQTELSSCQTAATSCTIALAQSSQPFHQALLESKFLEDATVVLLDPEAAEDRKRSVLDIICAICKGDLDDVTNRQRLEKLIPALQLCSTQGSISLRKDAVWALFLFRKKGVYFPEQQNNLQQNETNPVDANLSRLTHYYGITPGLGLNIQRPVAPREASSRPISTHIGGTQQIGNVQSIIKQSMEMAMPSNRQFRTTGEKPRSKEYRRFQQQMNANMKAKREVSQTDSSISQEKPEGVKTAVGGNSPPPSFNESLNAEGFPEKYKNEHQKTDEKEIQKKAQALIQHRLANEREHSKRQPVPEQESQNASSLGFSLTDSLSLDSIRRPYAIPPNSKVIFPDNTIAEEQIVSKKTLRLTPGGQKLDLPLEETISRVTQRVDRHYSTVAVREVIMDGRWRCDMTFQYSKNSRMIGIVSTSLNIPVSYSPGDTKQSAGYYFDGSVVHNHEDHYGNQRWYDGDVVSIEVDMDATPRVAHFFVNGNQQPISIRGLPESIRFCALLYHEGTSLDLLCVREMQKSSVGQILGDEVIDWDD
ncbi:hypothetical protein BLNAU_7025 [Blattamonas nauphoetae]|uniref:B30.2/SPRY domain-containing protein n=1 Tax=Blattamonas nauphoetae TaxID=2049346 RepID=A0ABQ9Y2Y0_9EUKA|nr:hypothetical protein BLNAU_7025 [Blattamonas nauphoetae]